MAQRGMGLLHCLDADGFGPLLTLNDQYPTFLCGNNVGPKISGFPGKTGLPAIIGKKCGAKLLVLFRGQLESVGRARRQKGGAQLVAFLFPEKPRYRKGGDHNDQPDERPANDGVGKIRAAPRCFDEKQAGYD